MLPCRAPQSIFCLLGFFSALWAQKRDVIFHMSNLSFSVSLDLVHLLPFLAFLWSEREVLWLILYDILLLGESHLSFCQQPWQPFCEGGDCKSKSSTCSWKEKHSSNESFNQNISTCYGSGWAQILTQNGHYCWYMQYWGWCWEPSCSEDISMLNAHELSESSVCDCLWNLCYNLYVRGQLHTVVQDI